MPDSQKACPSCQKTNAVESLFCAQCGHRFEMPKRFSGGFDRRQCVTCGRSMGSFEMHCTACATAPKTATEQVKIAPTMMPMHQGGQLAPNMPHSSMPPAYVPAPPPTPTYFAPPVVAPINAAPHIQCGHCHQWVPQGALQCQYCGVYLQQPNAYAQQQPLAQNPYATVQDNRAPVQQVFINTGPPPLQQTSHVPATMPHVGYALSPYQAKKDKNTAGVLALLLGGFGGHHFYMNNPVAGILSILFCWTYIPAFVGMVQGIMYLCMNEEEFQARHAKGR